MTTKEVMDLVSKTHNPKSNVNPPDAFLTAYINKTPVPPVKLDDKQVLAPMFQESHTLNFQMVELSKEPLTTKDKTVSPAKKRGTTTSPKKKNTKK